MGGGSGLAAAIAAVQAGASVIVLEKCGITGGSTNVSEGALNAVDPERQEPQGIEDSIPTFYETTTKGGHNTNNPELVHFLTDNALDSVHWLESLGAELICLSDIQLHPCGTPGTGLMEDIRTSGCNRIFVNTDGKRFVNEGAERDVLCKNIFAQPDGTYWIVVNTLRYPDPDEPDANGATIRVHRRHPRREPPGRQRHRRLHDLRPQRRHQRRKVRPGIILPGTAFFPPRE